MAKRPTPDVRALIVRERILLFCVGSGTDWQRAGVIDETVTSLVVKGLVSRDALGRLVLTNSGRATLRALLPDV
jgi:hypothetical protein